MKTIKVQDTYRRVSDEVANTEVSFKRATYAPKSEWKTNVRNVAKTEKAAVSDEKGVATKNRKAEKAAKLKNKQRPSEYTDKFIK